MLTAPALQLLRERLGYEYWLYEYASALFDARLQAYGLCPPVSHSSTPEARECHEHA